MSDHTTLYRLYDSRAALLYVGIAGNPGRRFVEHAKEKPWWSQVATTNLEHFSDRRSALDAERSAIVNERPLYNVVHNRAPSTPDRALALAPPIRQRLDVAMHQELMAAINVVANVRGLFDSQEAFAAFLAECGRDVPYGEWCERCADDAEHCPDPTTFPTRTNRTGDQLACDYVCPRCSATWTSWWHVDAPWMVSA